MEEDNRRHTRLQGRQGWEEIWQDDDKESLMQFSGGI